MGGGRDMQREDNFQCFELKPLQSVTSQNKIDMRSNKIALIATKSIKFVETWTTWNKWLTKTSANSTWNVWALEWFTLSSQQWYSLEFHFRSLGKKIVHCLSFHTKLSQKMFDVCVVHLVALMASSSNVTNGKTQPQLSLHTDFTLFHETFKNFQVLTDLTKRQRQKNVECFKHRSTSVKSRIFLPAHARQSLWKCENGAQFQTLCNTKNLVHCFALRTSTKSQEEEE